MYLTGIRLHNWMCFGGEQELSLEPKVYSITAESTDNPERSNWLGKTSFIDAIVFAVSGKLPQDVSTADGWIHRTEPEGAVDLEFANGLFISRARQRGKSTQLEVVLPDDKMMITGDDAQRWINEELVDYDTLSKTDLIVQKQTSQFITMSPSTRSEVVNAWLNLEPLEVAADGALNMLRVCSDDDEDLRKKLEQLSDDDPDELGKELAIKFDRVAKARLKFKEVDEKAEAYRNWKKALGNHESYLDKLQRREQLSTEMVKHQKVALDQTGLVALRTRLNKCAADRQIAQNQVAQKKKLKSGSFDGKCPVAGIECPVSQKINSNHSKNAELLTIATNQLKQVDASYKKIEAGYEASLDVSKRVAVYQSQIDSLDEDLAELKHDYDYIEQNPEPPDNVGNIARAASIDEIKEQLEEAVREHAEIVKLHNKAVADAVMRREYEEQLAALKPMINAWREAYLILGRTGAQRRIAEGALNEIEEMANHALREAGIKLQLKVQWAKETKQPAAQCDRCGAPFPKSARVKTCTRCGAARGSKLDEKLRIKLSNTSGGAKDLAGIFFQFAASRWLRVWRHSSWSVFMIDEPFGALDRANTKGVSAHITNLISQFGGTQAFIIAHHPDILEATPGRIHITNDDGVSTVKVLGGR